MKKLLKKILPSSLINQLMDVRDIIRLKAEAPLSFDPSKLRPITGINLKSVWDNQEIQEAWKKDELLIKKIFGNDDRFGGVNPGDRRALYYMIVAFQPKKVLEVGTHIGASTIHMACALKKCDKSATITTIDILDVNDFLNGPWKMVGMEKSPRDYAAQLNCQDYIEFQVGACQDFMHTTEQVFDLIFLDGDHSARAVYQEVSAALNILAPDGFLLLHDYYPNGKPLYPDGTIINGPFRAMERIQKENSSITVLPLGTLPWPTKQGTALTSLALVAKKAG